MFSYSSPESFVPQDHPLRPIRTMVEKALSMLAPDFAAMYSHTGRPSVPPEKLLKALLLQAFYSIRSTRLLMERIPHDIQFGWCARRDASESERSLGTARWWPRRTTRSG